MEVIVQTLFLIGIKKFVKRYTLCDRYKIFLDRRPSRSKMRVVVYLSRLSIQSLCCVDPRAVA